jgi:hypothetical protein
LKDAGLHGDKKQGAEALERSSRSTPRLVFLIV